MYFQGMKFLRASSAMRIQAERLQAQGLQYLHLAFAGTSGAGFPWGVSEWLRGPSGRHLPVPDTGREALLRPGEGLYDETLRCIAVGGEFVGTTSADREEELREAQREGAPPPARPFVHTVGEQLPEELFPATPRKTRSATAVPVEELTPTPYIGDKYAHHIPEDLVPQLGGKRGAGGSSSYYCRAPDCTFTGTRDTVCGHVRQIHLKLDVRCGLCDKPYRSHDGLVKHVRTAHGGMEAAKVEFLRQESARTPVKLERAAEQQSEPELQDPAPTPTHEGGDEVEPDPAAGVRETRRTKRKRQE